MRTAMLGDPGFGLGGGAVVDGHLVTRGCDMSCHGVTHDAEAEKCDFCHDVEVPVIESGRLGPVCGRWQAGPRVYSGGFASTSCGAGDAEGNIGTQISRFAMPPAAPILRSFSRPTGARQ